MSEPVELGGKGEALRDASNLINTSEQWFLVGFSEAGYATVVACQIEPAGMLAVVEGLADQLRALLERGVDKGT